jgi:outer membrane protein TolC
VLTAYTSYLANQGLVEANKLDVKDAEEAVKAASAMFAAGLVTRTDVLQAKATLSQRQLALNQAEGAESTSLGQLAVTIGLPPQTKLSVENLPQNLPIAESSGNIGELFELAKKRRPDLGVAAALIKEQEAQLGIAYSASMPTLTAFGTLNHTHFIHSPALDGHDNILGLQFNAPLFQGFYFVNQQKQLRAQIAEAVAALDLQVTQVALDIVTSYYALITAEKQIPTTLDFLEFSQRAYNGIKVQYTVGTSSILDVLNSLTILSDARASVVTARTTWALSRANLAFAVGILNDTDIQETPVKGKEEIAIEATSKEGLDLKR